MIYDESQTDQTPPDTAQSQQAGMETEPAAVTIAPPAPEDPAPQSPASQSPARKPGGQLGNVNAAKRCFRATVPQLPKEAKGREASVVHLRGLARSLAGVAPTAGQELLIAAACRQEVLVQLAMHWLCDSKTKLTIDQRLSTVAAMARAEEVRMRILNKLGLNLQASEPSNDPWANVDLTAPTGEGGADV